MQLQKQVNRVVEDKEYAKYVVIIPPEVVQKLDWSDTQELEHEVKEQTLIIRKAKTVNEEVMKIASKHLKVKRSN